MGRDFLPEDDRPGAAPVVLLGNGIWKNRYGSDPAIVGRTIRINDVPRVVIGVMPEGFKFPHNADLWQPLHSFPGSRSSSATPVASRCLADSPAGVSSEQAHAELVAIGQRLATAYPETNKDVLPKVQTFNERVNGGPIRAVFLSLMGAVAFVLLIACANVANLLLARSAQRSREIAVRVSIGATRWRIVRQLLMESVLLALISGVARARAVDRRHPAVRCRDAGRRQAVLDSIHDGWPVFAFLSASVSAPASSSGSRRRCTSRRPTSTRF